MNEAQGSPIIRAIWLIAVVASLVHVYRQSRRMHDGPIRHTLMVALCAWPLGYLCWVLWWPGSLRQWFLGSDEERIRREVDRRFGPTPERGRAPNRPVDSTHP